MWYTIYGKWEREGKIPCSLPFQNLLSYSPSSLANSYWCSFFLSPILGPQFFFVNIGFSGNRCARCPGTVPWRTKSWSCFSIELPPPGRLSVEWNKYLEQKSPVLSSTEQRCLHEFYMVKRVDTCGHRAAPHLSSFCRHRSPRQPLAGQSSVSQKRKACGCLVLVLVMVTRQEDLGQKYWRWSKSIRVNSLNHGVIVRKKLWTIHGFIWFRFHLRLKTCWWSRGHLFAQVAS